MTDLSIVLITKDQEWNISRLIDSVIKYVPAAITKEVVLVDSASRDHTLDIACSYPINILRLKPDQPLTPSAGRWVGTKYSIGEFILFLDGDMELCDGWLDRALSVMQTMPNVGVVYSPWINLPKAMERDNINVLEYAHDEDDGINIAVANIGGAGMYRRSVLRDVGTFNPYLYSDEEPELAIRIRYAGYDIFKLGHPIAYHYSDPNEFISTLIKRWKRNLWLGMGQSIRYHLGDELFWLYAKERGFGCFPALVLATGGLTLCYSLIVNNWLIFFSWLFFLLIVLTGLSIRKRSFYKMIYSVVQRLFVLDGTVRGFLIRPMKPSSYPCHVEIIKQET